MLTEIGLVTIEVPRDTDFDVRPADRVQTSASPHGVDEIVLSLSAKGLTTGEIAAHFDDVYGAKVSKDTISRITDKVTGEMTEWCNRPLDPGQVTNGPIYVVVGVTVAGERDILGLWAGDGDEGARRSGWQGAGVPRPLAG